MNVVSKNTARVMQVKQICAVALPMTFPSMYCKGDTPLDMNRGTRPELRSSAKVMPVDSADKNGKAIGSMVKTEKLNASYDVLCGVA